MRIISSLVALASTLLLAACGDSPSPSPPTSSTSPLMRFSGAGLGNASVSVDFTVDERGDLSYRCERETGFTPAQTLPISPSTRTRLQALSAGATVEAREYFGPADGLERDVEHATTRIAEDAPVLDEVIGLARAACDRPAPSEPSAEEPSDPTPLPTPTPGPVTEQDPHPDVATEDPEGPVIGPTPGPADQGDLLRSTGPGLGHAVYSADYHVSADGRILPSCSYLAREGGASTRRTDGPHGIQAPSLTADPGSLAALRALPTPLVVAHSFGPADEDILLVNGSAPNAVERRIVDVFDAQVNEYCATHEGVVY